MKALFFPQARGMNTGLPTWIEPVLDKVIQTLQNDIVKKKIQLLVLEPFLQYFLELVFPYVILMCVIFGIMIIAIFSILALLVFRLNSGSSGGS